MSALQLLKKRIAVVLKDPNRKSTFRILSEMLSFWYHKKELPYFYLGKFLYRKDVKEYKAYLSSKEVDKITYSKRLHQDTYATLLRNKLAFTLHTQSHKLPIPKLVGYNFKQRFYDAQGVITAIDSLAALVTYFQQLLQQQGYEQVFVKSITDMGGKGCFLIHTHTLEQDLAACYPYLITHDCLFQEVVVQHPQINKIYPHSLNTIRFTTYIDTQGKPHILSAFMRFGAGGSVIDNSNAGGMSVGIDLEKGILVGTSHQLMKHGGQQLAAHPDTATVFHGYEIPYFDAAKQLIHDVLECIPDRMVGWDIAIAKHGPILIEGNDNNSLITPDIIYGGYLKHPLFKEIMEQA